MTASISPAETAHRRGAAIAMRAVAKSFGPPKGGYHALGPISLDVRPGEFVSIIGPSGCGKSTTMLIAAGLMSASAGQVEIDGVALDRPLTDVGIVFQDHLLLDFRTAIDNVMLQQQIRRLDRAAMLAKAGELFRKLGLTGAEGRYPRQLSGGMRQRVSIARALVHEPSILLMDEPFGALDAISRTQIRHDLERLWLDTQKTVLFITHSIEEAIGLSDRVLVMSQGPRAHRRGDRRRSAPAAPGPSRPLPRVRRLCRPHLRYLREARRL